jgi:NADPH:quinone reductase-like Zn-dependent oxidoreductase
VIDFVGASHWDENIAALAPDGRMVILSFLSGRELEKVHLGPPTFKRLRIQRFMRDVVGKLTGAEGHRKQPRSRRITLGTYLQGLAVQSVRVRP